MSFIICFIKYGTIITNILLHDENLNLKSSDKYVEKKKRYDPDATTRILDGIRGP